MMSLRKHRESVREYLLLGLLEARFVSQAARCNTPVTRNGMHMVCKWHVSDANCCSRAAADARATHEHTRKRSSGGIFYGFSVHIMNDIPSAA